MINFDIIIRNNCVINVFKSVGVSRFEISLRFFRIVISIHGWVTFLPISWANISIFGMELTSLHQSEHFINVSSNWELVLGVAEKGALGTDDVSGSEGNTLVVT